MPLPINTSPPEQMAKPLLPPFTTPNTDSWEVTSNGLSIIGPEEGQGVSLNITNDLPENPDLEIDLPDSDEEYQPSRKPVQSLRKGKKGKKGKPQKESSVEYPSPIHLSPSSLQFSFDMSTSVVGRLAPREQLFCPLIAVTKFPYKYVRKEDSDKVSKAYFAEGKFWARGWTVFYIHTLLQSYSKPLIVVPASEVESLLFEINDTLKLHLGFPHPSIEPGFLLRFLEEGSPCPRYLSRVVTKGELETMEKKIPGPGFHEDGEDALDPCSFPAFRVKMEAAIQTGKNRSKVSKEKRKKERIILKGSWCAQLKRAQRYLGIRPEWSALINPHSIPDLDWDELQAAERDFESAKNLRDRDIDITKPAPNVFHQNVIFISVDVESYERDRKAITEIGISTLDTNDLINLPPGEGGLAWMKKIRSRHFRVRENSHLVNSDFVAGCADRFEKKFGSSEWISINEAPQVVASCFKPPFSSPLPVTDPKGGLPGSDYRQPPCQSNSVLRSPSFSTESDDDGLPKRNIILVGHDVKADIDYLRSIGYDLSNLSNILEAVDTADLFRALRHEQQSRSLGGVLLELNLVGWNLHNAGNDAAYTLQAMIGISFKGLQNSRDRRAKIAGEEAARQENAARDAREHVIQESQEWELADIDEGDGGDPVKLLRLDPARNPQNGSSKVNVAERSAKETLNANKSKEQEPAAKIEIANVSSRSRKNGILSSGDEGTLVSPGQKKKPAGYEIATQSYQVRGESTDRIGDDPKLGPDEVNKIITKGAGHEELDILIKKQGMASVSVDESNGEDIGAVPIYLLDRLALLEAMDMDEDGGVKL